MMVILDFKEAQMLAKVVWRSATARLGAQCVMTSGTMWMLV
jgi:hypothetical protein